MKKIYAFSFAAFVAGVTGVQIYAHRLKSEVSGGAPTDVLVVTQDLKAGALLSKESLASLSVPSEYVDPRRILAKERAHLLGVEISVPLRAGDGLVWSDLSDGAAHKHLAALVSPGMRAYSLDGDANPLGGLLRVGDQVDVLLEEGGETELLVEQVLVLSVGGRLKRSEEVEGSATRAEGVTLSVTTDQAEQILAAESRGDLRLVLRNPEDRRRVSKAEEEQAPGPARVQSVARAEKKEIEHVR